jgi:iron complex outermembrane receptor protein
MKKITLLLFSFLFAITLSIAQTDSIPISDTTNAVILEECVIEFYRANKNTPITYKNIDVKELDEKSVGQEPAFILNETPSVNVYSDAGNMVGYSYFRLRGIDQTRINMTWDGIPLNEGEDQGVYFNNYPDFFNSVSSIQIQRGIGISSNGVSSYGGSINFQSPTLFGDTSLQIGLDYGSYNSYRDYIEYSSGKRNNVGFYIRASSLRSDGYKEHSQHTSQSVLFSTGYMKGKHLLKLTGTIGHQENEMAWLGASKEQLENNPKYNSLYTYGSEMEKDNFTQSLMKLQHTFYISEKSKLSSTVYYNYL